MTRTASALPAVPGESAAAESPLTEFRQFRVTPEPDDATTTTSNSLRAASTGTPPRPYLWVWVEGQTG